jgi:Protein of unknown function (DUF616)
MRVALYSAIYDRYDTPKPLPTDLDVPAYLYTDSRETALIAEVYGWTVRLNHEHRELGPMLQHKYWKTHPTEAVPDVDVSLWLDGSMTITADRYVKRCVEALGDDDWVTVRHPWRDCIYDEAVYSATLPRYGQPVLQQVEFYRFFGHPAHWGLIATGANVRRHTDAVATWSHHWWVECLGRTHQDQLSLPVLLRLAGDEIKWNYDMPWWEWWHLHEHTYGR